MDEIEGKTKIQKAQGEEEEEEDDKISIPSGALCYTVSVVEFGRCCRSLSALLHRALTSSLLFGAAVRGWRLSTTLAVVFKRLVEVG